MTPAPHTPPPESVADAILHDLAETGALWPAVERMLRARLPEVPGWVRQAGEYQPYLPPQGMARFSLGREPEAVCSVWRRADGWYRWDAERRDVGPFDTQHAAMADADTEAREAGWLFDPSLPLEEPQPEPTPAPEPEEGTPRGPGRRAGQHRWAVSAQEERLDLCSECGRWRWRPVGKGQRYLPAGTIGARQAFERGVGLEMRAGACPGRQP